MSTGSDIGLYARFEPLITPVFERISEICELFYSEPLVVFKNLGLISEEVIAKFSKSGYGSCLSVRIL